MLKVAGDAGRKSHENAALGMPSKDDVLATLRAVQNWMDAYSASHPGWGLSSPPTFLC